MGRARLLILFFILSLPALSLAAEAPVTIKICGTGDSQELLRRLARFYEDKHRGIIIEVPNSIGSSGGVKATAAGKCDIGRLARPLKEKEKHYGLNYKLFAHSPVVFLVSKNLRDISNITADQVVGVFSGRITSWQELGGATGKIYVANREKGDSSRSVIEKHIPAFEKIGHQAGKTIYSTPETIAAVANNDNTIAYAPLSSIGKRTDIHVLSFEGVKPDPATIGNGKYHLASDYGLVWREGIRPQALDFINFLDSAEAVEIISEFGTAPVAQE